MCILKVDYGEDEDNYEEEGGDEDVKIACCFGVVTCGVEDSPIVADFNKRSEETKTRTKTKPGQKCIMFKTEQRHSK